MVKNMPSDGRDSMLDMTCSPNCWCKKKNKFARVELIDAMESQPVDDEKTDTIAC